MNRHENGAALTRTLLKSGFTALLNQPRWCLYRVEPRVNGKSGKPPKMLDGMSNQRSKDPRAQWPYDQVLQAYMDGSGDGIGVMLGDVDGLHLSCIDVDDCTGDADILKDWAKPIAEALSCGFVETSLSKKGMHHFYLGAKPTGTKCRQKVGDGEVECYDNGRFMVITGARCGFADKGLNNDTSGAKWICKRYLTDSKPTEREQSRARGEWLKIGLDKDGVLSSMWVGSRSSSDESSNDLAFMNKLVYWLGRDFDTVREAFLSSPYFQQKDDKHAAKAADREDYLKRTFDKAVQGVKSTAEEDDARYQVDSAYTSRPEAPPAQKQLNSISASDLMGKQFDPLRQPLEGLITEGLTLFVGASKIGKSWLVLRLCTCIAGGELFWGRKTSAGAVLYLALEDGERRLKDRMSKVLRGAFPPQNLYFATRADVLRNGLEAQIENFIKSNPQISMIVIDTLQKVRPAAKGGANAYAEDYALMGILKGIADKHHIAIMLVHHTNKLRIVTDKFDKISGSTGLMGAADTTIILDRERGSDDATVSVEGRDVSVADFIIRFENFRWELASQDAHGYHEKKAADESQAAQAFRQWVMETYPDGCTMWSGTPTELMEAVFQHVGYSLPFTVDKFGKELMKHSATLHADGITLGGAGGHSRGRRRTVTYNPIEVHEGSI